MTQRNSLPAIGNLSKQAEELISQSARKSVSFVKKRLSTLPYKELRLLAKQYEGIKANQKSERLINALAVKMGDETLTDDEEENEEGMDTGDEHEAVVSGSDSQQKSRGSASRKRRSGNISTETFVLSPDIPQSSDADMAEFVGTPKTRKSPRISSTPGGLNQSAEARELKIMQELERRVQLSMKKVKEDTSILREADGTKTKLFDEENFGSAKKKARFDKTHGKEFEKMDSIQDYKEKKTKRYAELTAGTSDRLRELSTPAKKLKKAEERKEARKNATKERGGAVIAKPVAANFGFSPSRAFKPPENGGISINFFSGSPSQIYSKKPRTTPLSARKINTPKSTDKKMDRKSALKTQSSTPICGLKKKSAPENQASPYDLSPRKVEAEGTPAGTSFREYVQQSGGLGSARKSLMENTRKSLNLTEAKLNPAKSAKPTKRNAKKPAPQENKPEKGNDAVSVKKLALKSKAKPVASKPLKAMREKNESPQKPATFTIAELAAMKRKEKLQETRKNERKARTSASGTENAKPATRRSSAKKGTEGSSLFRPTAASLGKRNTPLQKGAGNSVKKTPTANSKASVRDIAAKVKFNMSENMKQGRGAYQRYRGPVQPYVDTTKMSDSEAMAFKAARDKELQMRQQKVTDRKTGMRSAVEKVRGQNKDAILLKKRGLRA